MLIKTSSFPVNNQTEKIEIATFFLKIKVHYNCNY